MIAADSSAVVAALCPWHPAHAAARAALSGGEERALPAHAAFETVAVLSRLPNRFRVAPTVALDAITRDYGEAWIAPDADVQRGCLRRAVDAGLRGGALYDALIAATAVEHGASLLSADRRAAVTYELMGARAEYVAI